MKNKQKLIAALELLLAWAREEPDAVETKPLGLEQQLTREVMANYSQRECIPGKHAPDVTTPNFTCFNCGRPTPEDERPVECAACLGRGWSRAVGFDQGDYGFYKNLLKCETCDGQGEMYPQPALCEAASEDGAKCVKRTGHEWGHFDGDGGHWMTPNAHP